MCVCVCACVTCRSCGLFASWDYQPFQTIYTRHSAPGHTCLNNRGCTCSHVLPTSILPAESLMMVISNNKNTRHVEMSMKKPIGIFLCRVEDVDSSRTLYCDLIFYFRLSTNNQYKTQPCHYHIKRESAHDMASRVFPKMEVASGHISKHIYAHSMHVMCHSSCIRPCGHSLML